MDPEKYIEIQLEQLAQAIPSSSSFVDGVMNRLETSSDNLQKQSIHIHFVRRLFMKTSVKFAAAAIILIAAFLSLTLFNKTVPNAAAAEIFSSAIATVSNIQSIYMKLQMRTLPADNFMHLDLDLDFVPIEMWKKTDPDGQTRVKVQKPNRVLVMDDTSATMIINNETVSQTKGLHRQYGCFDSGWLTQLLDVDSLLKNELEELAQKNKKYEVSIHHKTTDGHDRLVVERYCPAEGDYSQNDYLKNKFIDEANRTFIYYFDPETKILTGFQVVVHVENKDVLVCEATDIQYNPSIDDSEFKLEIPKDAIFSVEPQALPDNEKYQNMTAQEAAEAFFKACSENDWNEAMKFWPLSSITEGFKQKMGGIEIISIGKPFKSGFYGGWFVPYEIKKNGRTQKFNMAIRNDNPAKRWQVDGGL
jgi:hypothetical protein